MVNETNLMKNYVPFLGALLIAHSVIADPSITKASIATDTIVIDGANFGDNNPMVFWDDVSDQFKINNTSGQEVPITDQFKWGQNASQFAFPMSFFKPSTDSTASLSAKNPTKSQKNGPYYFGAGHSSYLGKPKLSDPNAVSKELYVSWWYRPSIDPRDQGGSNKFIRVWDNEDGKGTRISWTQMHLTCIDSGTENQVSWATWNGDIGKWNHHEFYINLNPGKEKIVARVNGKVLHDITNCTKDTALYKDAPLFVGLIGFDHGSGAYTTMETSIDDIYIGKLQARVVVSKSPTWSNASANEVLPIKSWTNNKIEAGLISLTSNERVSHNTYVYVVDENGLVNANGIKLQCPSCPVMQ